MPSLTKCSLFLAIIALPVISGMGIAQACDKHVSHLQDNTDRIIYHHIKGDPEAGHSAPYNG